MPSLLKKLDGLLHLCDIDYGTFEGSENFDDEIVKMLTPSANSLAKIITSEPKAIQTAFSEGFNRLQKLMELDERAVNQSTSK